MSQKLHLFWKPIGVAALAAICVGILGGVVTDIGPWYQSLNKPSWQPPDWLFGPVWTLIFGLTALSAVLAWRRAPDDRTRTFIIILFVANAALNVLWSSLFFGLKRPDYGLYEVGFLWLSILIPMIVLTKYSKASSRLLIPYLLWVSFAAALNYKIVQLNPI